LQAVVKETLRLHHPAPLSVPHYNTEDTVIGGYLIPAGTSIFTDLWAIQRNPEDWGEDASEFNPDRFLEKDVNVVGSSDLQYIPFGAGPVPEGKWLCEALQWPRLLLYMPSIGKRFLGMSSRSKKQQEG
jgi:hypothetical protein